MSLTYTSYLSDHFPNGKIRKARIPHVCWRKCGNLIKRGAPYFDAGPLDPQKPAKGQDIQRYCRDCSKITESNYDMFTK